MSLNPLPAPVRAEGFTDTEMQVVDGRVAKYGPGPKKESFCPATGSNSIFTGRRFVYTRSDFLSFGSFMFPNCGSRFRATWLQSDGRVVKY